MAVAEAALNRDRGQDSVPSTARSACGAFDAVPFRNGSAGLRIVSLFVRFLTLAQLSLSGFNFLSHNFHASVFWRFPDYLSSAVLASAQLNDDRSVQIPCRKLLAMLHDTVKKNFLYWCVPASVNYLCMVYTCASARHIALV